MQKYKKPEGVTLPLKMICINCGKEEMSSYSASLPKPNTAMKMTKGFLGPQPGTWLGCKLGSHDYYGEHELIPNE